MTSQPGDLVSTSEKQIRENTDTLTTDWNEGIQNDGVHEWTPTYECSGEFLSAWRRTPAAYREAGEWERQDAMPTNLTYPASTA